MTQTLMPQNPEEDREPKRLLTPPVAMTLLADNNSSRQLVSEPRYRNTQMAKRNQAVKEALQDRDISTFRDDLERLRQEIREGFKGVHERQDTSNGKVLGAQQDILLMKQGDKYNKLIWYGFTVATSAIGVLVTYILMKP